MGSKVNCPFVGRTKKGVNMIDRQELFKKVKEYNSTLSVGQYTDRGVEEYHEGLRSGHGFDDWLDIDSALGLINYILTVEDSK